MTITDLGVRPWYRGPIPDFGDHIFADCPRLAEEGGPREGVGWLNPYGRGVCPDCRHRHDPTTPRRRLSDEY